MKRHAEALLIDTPPKQDSIKSAPENHTTFRILDDLLYNVLHFLDRKEIENKRLVSKQWNYNILANDTILPLIVLGKISYSPAYGRVCWNIVPDKQPNSNNLLDLAFPIPHRLETLSTHFLKSHIYKKIEFSMNDKEIETLRKILKRKERRLKVIEASFVLEGHLTSALFEEDMKRLNTILNEIISAKKIVIKFINCSEATALHRFIDFNIKLPLSYELIKLDISLSFIETSSSNYYSNICLDFIKNAGQQIELLLNCQNLVPELGENLVEFFMDHNKPEMMIHSLSYINRNKQEDIFNEFIDRTIKIFMKKKADCIIISNSEEHYCLKRVDGWSLDFCFLNFGFVKSNDVETWFTIEKH